MRWRGILLFLFIPTVLFLFLKQPIGTVGSLFLGALLMIGHRFIAEPFSERYRERRCLWCGRSIVHPVELEPLSYALCADSERDCGVRWSGLHRLGIRGATWIRLGIGVPLVYYLVAELVRGFEDVGFLTHAENTLVFQGIVAATVTTVSLLYYRYRCASPAPSIPSPSGAFPFPIHNLTLLGAGWTLWIFRIVGIYWLVGVIRSLFS